MMLGERDPLERFRGNPEMTVGTLTDSTELSYASTTTHRGYRICNSLSYGVKVFGDARRTKIQHSACAAVAR